MLCHQTARKFDAAAAETLATAIAGVTDPDRLARVGDWIIECATAKELLARVRSDAGRAGEGRRRAGTISSLKRSRPPGRIVQSPVRLDRHAEPQVVARRSDAYAARPPPGTA